MIKYQTEIQMYEFTEVTEVIFRFVTPTKLTLTCKVRVNDRNRYFYYFYWVLKFSRTSVIECNNMC